LLKIVHILNFRIKHGLAREKDYGVLKVWNGNHMLLSTLVLVLMKLTVLDYLLKKQVVGV